jgi:hypothetical protein
MTPTLLLLLTLAAPEPRDRVGVIVVPGGPNNGAAVPAESWAAAFADAPAVKAGRLTVETLASPDALTAALTTRGGQFLAIANPSGEMFLCAGPDDGAPMARRIHDWVAAGGAWWESGGWPLCYPFWPKAGGGFEQGRTDGPVSAAFGLAGRGWTDDAAPARLTTTLAARFWLGATGSAAIAGQRVDARRPAAREGLALVLAEAGGQPWLSGSRVGSGWLFRPGGFSPPAEVVLPAAVGVVEHLAALRAALANPEPGSPAARPHPPTRIGLIAPEPSAGVPHALDPQDLRDCLNEIAPVRGAGVEVTLLTTPPALRQALTDLAGDYLAIINPLGESFLVADEGDAPAMLTAIKRYVAGGGIWWETAGYPFWYHLWPEVEGGRTTGWRHGNYGGAGLATFGVKGAIVAESDPPPPLEITPLGRQWLGQDWCGLLAGERADANRPTEVGPGDPVLLTAGGRPYVQGHRVGSGLLFTVGGTWGHPTAVFPAILASLSQLWGHALPPA